jgi:hypothetical protein
MRLTILVAGVALAALTAAGGATAGQTARATAAVAGPAQPIPYSQLNAYLKASPKQRTSKDWWSGSANASTGVSTDTSASVPVNERTSDSLPSTPPTNQPDATTTQPASSAMQPGGPVKDPSVEPK